MIDDIVCMYACPNTNWRNIPFEPPKDLSPKEDFPKKFNDTEIGPDYIVSGDMMTFYGVNTPEKRQKMIETFEELKKL